MRVGVTVGVARGTEAAPPSTKEGPGRMAQHKEQFQVVRSDEEWRRMLTPEQYQVLRGHGTERPGSCALLAEHRHGTFTCAGCGQPLVGVGLALQQLLHVEEPQLDETQTAEELVERLALRGRKSRGNHEHSGDEQKPAHSMHWPPF